ncbi:GNAT family N-acetyltransferase [Patescibacteria group bacterium]|nr:GNAT family N-acetyltransferase [Patescibacteria group bacterium]
MKLSVRKATIDDAKQIAKIHVETWQDAYKRLIPSEYLDSLSIEKKTEKWREMLSDPKSKTIYLVGCIGKNVLGWSSLTQSRDKDSSDDVGELGGIYVHPSAQKKGLGSMLMSRGLLSLKKLGYKRATLWVLTANLETRNYYESKGWRVEGKTKTEPRNGFKLHETRYAIEL